MDTLDNIIVMVNNCSTVKRSEDAEDSCLFTQKMKIENARGKGSSTLQKY